MRITIKRIKEEQQDIYKEKVGQTIMTFLERLEQNKSLYERNKKEIINKLLRGEYPKDSRLIITIGVTEFKIYEFKIKYLLEKQIDFVKEIFEYVIAYTFID